MDQSVVALENFIDGFALKHPDGIVYFYANIQFIVNGHMQKLDSDVHILTSDNLATIYIMGLGTRPWELPDMFSPKKDKFTFIENECLKIEGSGEGRKYIVHIYPKAMDIF